jgi:hypothetical protein
VLRTIADYRQLNDALFHAGVGSGSSCEWEDPANRLHFYVIDRKIDACGILSYKVGVRSLDGAGPQGRGVALSAPSGFSAGLLPAGIDFRLTNTGPPTAMASSHHPCDASPCLHGDIYRLSASVNQAGWTAEPVKELAALGSGGWQNVTVRVGRAPGSAAAATVTLTARSESDPGQSAQASLLVTIDQ